MGLRRWLRQPTLRWWRRSVQARVVASTILLSVLVIVAVAWFQIQQTREGLLRDRREYVLSQVASATAEAQTRITTTLGTDLDVVSQRNQLVQPLIQTGYTQGFDVVLAGPVTEEADGTLLGRISSEGLDPASVPDGLEEHFFESSTTAWAYTEVLSTDGRSLGPGITVGTSVSLPADDSIYTLYYIYPLTDQEDTLRLVTSALVTASVLLVLMVAGIAWLVTRQVVAPVREARRVAEQLSAGDLEQRLKVRGEDDLARLATSFNQMAANLQGQITELETLSRMQQRFVSDVSHELRTPLTTVRMASDVLHDARAELDPVAARSAELLQSELDKFELLLADLLEISRYDAKAMELDVDDVELVDLVRRVIVDTERVATQSGMEVRLIAPRTVYAEGDERRIERIIRNLINNAIDHAEGSDVVVRIKGTHKAAAIAVRDRGVGLTQEQAALVFARFWRADPARARTRGGTGLGLSISLEDARLHGGWLRAWGRPGEGAQFTLTLPRYADEPLTESPIPMNPDTWEAT